MDTSTHGPLAFSAANELHARRDRAQLGMWVFLASEVLFFGGLLFAYAVGRSHWPQGFAQASRETDVVIGTLNTAILLTSSAFAALAALFSKEEAQRGRAVNCLWITVALGLAFLGLKVAEWHSEWHEGLFPGPGFGWHDGQPAPQGAELFFMLYFVMTGVHALHMLIGIAVVSVVAIRASKARHSQTRGEPLTSVRVDTVALYWHFVDIVWIVLYPLLYLVERHS